MANFSKQQVNSFLVAALECSFYAAPETPGLTYNELLEAGRRYGLQNGEINDSLPDVTDVYYGSSPEQKLLPKKGSPINFQYFVFREEPEFRDIRAFDFVYQEWRDGSRAHGRGQVQLEYNVLVERAVNAGVSRSAIQTAIAILVFTETFSKEAGVLRPNHVFNDITLPSESFNRNLSMGNRPTIINAVRAAANPIVRDIIARRNDGRLLAIEPLDAFANELEKLGYGHFRLWWQQLVGEVRLISSQTAPVAVTVLYAALVEGALTFVVGHARKLQLGTLGSKTFDGSPTTWKIDDLVTSAAAGKDSAILDATSRQRADLLIRTRQRIHAGRMLSEFPGGPPDLRPEEARDAKTTAELVVRRVLDWLQRFQG